VKLTVNSVSRFTLTEYNDSHIAMGFILGLSTAWGLFWGCRDSTLKMS